MKHLKRFNENNDLPEGLNVNGLKCDNPNCDWSDMSVPFSDYEKSINKPCPQCGENLLTQEDYDQVIQIKQAMELMATFSEEELNNIVSSLSEEEIDQALDKMNQLKMKKKGEDEQGREIWSIGESRKLKNIKKFNESIADDKVSILNDIALDLIDDNYQVYVRKCGKNINYNIPNFSRIGLIRVQSSPISLYENDSSKIMVVIKYDSSNSSNLSTEDFNNRVDEYVKDCEYAGVKYRSSSGGDYFRVIFFEKWQDKR